MKKINQKKMKEQIIKRIMEDVKRGDYGLVSSIINNIHSRVLYQKLPSDLKQEVAHTFIGNKINIIQVLHEEGTEDLHEVLDEIEAFVVFNDIKLSLDSVILHKQTSILGGDEVDGWKYNLEDFELIQSYIPDPDGVQSKPFKAKVIVDIDGLILDKTTRETVIDAIEMEMSPIFISPEFVKVSSKINELSLEL